MILRVCSLLLVLLCYCALPAYADQPWILASDIHLNPFDRSHAPASAGSDSNEALLDAAIAQMRRVEPNPQVVVLSGDFLAHHFETLAQTAGQTPVVASEQTMREIAAKFGQAFPHAHFLIVMGNNDDPCGDYETSADSAYLRALAQIWAPLVNRDGAAPDFVKQFGRGGYYTATLPGVDERAIVLDNIYWSFRYRNACGTAQQTPGADEFAWFEDALKATPAGRRNLVVMHIPPGPDAFSTSLIQGIGIVPFMGASNDNRLRALLADPRNRVAWALAGHAHRTELRTISDVPLLIVPSISPVYRNDPAFFVAQLTPSGDLHDYVADAYSQRDKKWAATYDLDSTFHVTALSGQAVRAIHAREQAGWLPPPASAFAADRFAMCAQTALAPDAYGACASVPNRRTVWVLTGAGGIVVLGIAGVVLARRRRRVI
jgi:hypothetical protein